MIGNKIILKKGGHFQGFKDEVDRNVKTDDEFLSWFDTSTNKQEAFRSGEWDFAYHIFNQVVDYIGCPNQITALEIGYGGGRLTCAASRYFSQVIGVDIHNQSEYVLNLMKERCVDNVELVTLSSKSFPISDESIDLVYSFIVFQHLESIEILDKYLEECSRVLKKGGVGCIYFGRKSVISEGRSEKSLYFLDRFFELFLRKGYLEIESRVNEKNLVLSLSKVRGVLKKHGFIVKNINISRKKIIGQEKKLGGQYGAVFQKI